jgi:hypothetical protein
LSNEFFEQTLVDLTRKGALDKVKFLKNLHRKVLPSQFERIKRNDKAVLKELFMPGWVSWELLRAWADNFKIPGKGKECIFCGNRSQTGIDFEEKFICEGCFLRIKQLE